MFLFIICYPGSISLSLLCYRLSILRVMLLLHSFSSRKNYICIACYSSCALSVFFFSIDSLAKLLSIAISSPSNCQPRECYGFVWLRLLFDNFANMILITLARSYIDHILNSEYRLQLNIIQADSFKSHLTIVSIDCC